MFGECYGNRTTDEEWLLKQLATRKVSQKHLLCQSSVKTKRAGRGRPCCFCITVCLSFVCVVLNITCQYCSHQQNSTVSAMSSLLQAAEGQTKQTISCSTVWSSAELHNSAFITADRLDGLVVKASALRAEDPGFESCLRRDFSGSSHTSD